MPSEGAVLRLEDRREFEATILGAASRQLRAAGRVRAALALGRIGDRRAVPLLEELASDGEVSVRRAALFGLGLLKQKESVSLFAERLEDADPESAALAAEGLGKIGDLGVLPRLEAVLAVAPAAVKGAILVSLFRYRDNGALRLADAYVSDGDAELRWRALFTLNRFPQEASRRSLRQGLLDSSPLARAFAARGLGGTENLEDLEALAPLLGDPSPQVRVSVLRALAAILAKHSASTGSALAGAVLGLAADTDPGVRLTAIEALSRFTTHEAVGRRLVEIAGEDNGKASNLALKALAIGKVAGAMELAVSAKSSPDRYRRAAAAQALGAIGTSAALQELGTLLADGEPLVRASVLDAFPESHLQGAAGRLRHVLVAEEDAIVRATLIDRLAGGERLTGLKDLILEETFQEAFRAAWEDSVNDAQLSALRALAAFGNSPTARATLMDAGAHHRDPLVRRAAREALLASFGVPENELPAVVFETGIDLAEYERIADWARERHTATLSTRAGIIRLRLRADQAPLTAWNFVRLARAGYFSGLRWHRVVPNFVIQDGDPRGDGSGGPGYQIRDEINPLRYGRGAVGMALSGPDTGGSQYFICHSPQPHLDGGYTVFAEVSEGLDVVDQVIELDGIARVEAE